ncbi:MAG TPA: GAF domain-containing protein, partial [Anaerolineales bacterium]|nr:GAF domain-containing protein [Anaerolineales bacterium]
DAFNKTTQELLQTLASQTAIVLTNIWQYQLATRKTEMLSGQAQALNHLLETRKQIETDTSLKQALDILGSAIQEVSLFDVVVIYTYDPSYEMIQPVSMMGIEKEDEEVFREIFQPWETVQKHFQEEYKLSRSYRIPFDQLTETGHLIPDFVLLNYTVPKDSEDAWIPGDMFLLPVYDAHNRPLGLILVDVPLDGLIPAGTKLEMLELFAAEVALVIERNQKVTELKEQIEEVETKISKAEAEIQASHTRADLTVLLKKDLEQTVALQQLYHRAKNIRIGMDISDSVNRQPDRQSVLNSLASQLLTEMELDIALLVEPTDGGPRLIGQFGPVSDGTNPQALLGQRNPLRQTIQNGAMIYVPDLDEDLEWQATPLLKSLNAKGFICLPISFNGDVEAAVLAVSQSTLRDITPEDEQVFELITNQVSLTIQNLNLLTETRRRLREVNLLLDFSRQLGSLDTQEILNTLVSSIRRVLPNAHGVRVMLWDEAEKGLVTETASGYNDNDILSKIVHTEENSIIYQTFSKGSTQLVDEIDFAVDYDLTPENLLRYREATGGRLPVSSLLVPMKTADNIQGVVEVDNFNTVAAFSQEDLALIESLTQQVALGLENARLFSESRRINEELEKRVAARTQELAREHQFTQILLQISTELSSSLDLDMVLNRSLMMLNDATGAEQCNIYIHRIPEPHLIYRAGAGIHDSPSTGGSPSNLLIKEGLAGWVIESQKPVVIKDLLKDEKWKLNHGVNPVYRSTLAAPLIVGQDALGCLLLFHRQPNHFEADQLDAIQAAANQFAVTINNGELFQLIRDQAEDLGTMLRAQQIETSRSKAMLEGVGDGVLVTDNHNVITLFNDAAELILELDESSVVGKSLDEFVGLFGGAAESWMDTIRSWSVSPNIQNAAEMYTERLTLEDGRVISVHLSPVSDMHEFLGTISIFRDITHQVEVDRLKSEFVATVSHELRTPMTPIKGYVEFLLMGGTGDLNEQQREFLNIIKTNVDRLGILVNDLLDVSRIEAGKVALSFQPIDLQEVVHDSVNTILHQSEEDDRPVKVDVEMPDNLPSIYGDNERVRQIVTNLVDNAYKYSPEGSVVRLVVKELEDTIQVSVIDQGIGIFPDEHDKIFERFYRGENHLVMATAGTGLGLPIVKELVEMHNGRIWVTSSGVPGEGSAFSFTLPLYQSEKETAIGD